MAGERRNGGGRRGVLTELDAERAVSERGHAQSRGDQIEATAALKCASYDSFQLAGILGNAPSSRSIVS